MIKNINQYFRPAVSRMAGYVPGEQPKVENLVKLNTNENPYPPSPGILAALREFDYEKLRRYPDPLATELRQSIAARFGVDMDMVIAGNGSDDLLTMVFRCFTDAERLAAGFYPTYSLYEVLAEMQDSKFIRLPLGKDFSCPAPEVMELAKKANLLLITRPNAPTGNAFSLEWNEKVVREFDGIVVFDEAYADFAGDNCMELAKKYGNVLVMRTFSKSYSLAGLRLGYAVGSKEIIEGMMKVKDSYNLDMLTQKLGKIAFDDEAYLRETVSKVKEMRQFLAAELVKRDYRVIDSQTNFLFVSPPDRDGRAYFEKLRNAAVLVRYFPAEPTREFVRITVGRPDEMEKLLSLS